MKIIKVLVDKLPKNCKTCKFYRLEKASQFPYQIIGKYCELYGCNKKIIHVITKDRAEFCPLCESKIDGMKVDEIT